MESWIPSKCPYLQNKIHYLFFFGGKIGIVPIGNQQRLFNRLIAPFSDSTIQTWEYRAIFPSLDRIRDQRLIVNCKIPTMSNVHQFK